jgi:hypothetical protein
MKRKILKSSMAKRGGSVTRIMHVNDRLTLLVYKRPRFKFNVNTVRLEDQGRRDWKNQKKKSENPVSQLVSVYIAVHLSGGSVFGGETVRPVLIRIFYVSSDGSLGNGSRNAFNNSHRTCCG